MAADIRTLNPDYSPVLYRWGQRICSTLFRAALRCETVGLENIPKAEGAFIFAANHRSLIDPPLVGSLVPKTIFYFAKEELFRIPFIGWYIRCVNSIPIRRAAHDVGAFKMALTVLESGYPLLLFPEGGRRLDPRKQWIARPGIGMLAAKTQAPVIPVGITNTEHLGRLAKVRVSFGVPIPAPADTGGDTYQQFADLVMVRIREQCQ